MAVLDDRQVERFRSEGYLAIEVAVGRGVSQDGSDRSGATRILQRKFVFRGSGARQLSAFRFYALFTCRL
jgi:hypothetical protein